MSSQRPEPSLGLAAGAAAYVLWGAFPLYFPLLAPASATEVLAHRIVWSAVTMTVLVLVLRQTRALLELVRDRRTLALLAAAAAVITVNWGVYIGAVTHERVVEAALGYFINPLVTVLLGVLVLGERLRAWQWAALAVAVVAVVVITVDYGRPPWVALVLAFSFGTYGLLKKSADVGAVTSLTLETCLLAPLALAYLVWLGARGTGTFTTDGAGHTALLMSAGVVTAVPLILFGAAATRVSLVTIGLLQYLAPVLQFLIGVLVVGEHMPAARWVGFVLVWVALVVLTLEALAHRRTQLKRAAAASPAL